MRLFTVLLFASLSWPTFADQIYNCQTDSPRAPYVTFTFNTDGSFKEGKYLRAPGNGNERQDQRASEWNVLAAPMVKVVGGEILVAFDDWQGHDGFDWVLKVGYGTAALTETETLDCIGSSTSEYGATCSVSH